MVFVVFDVPQENLFEGLIETAAWPGLNYLKRLSHL